MSREVRGFGSFTIRHKLGDSWVLRVLRITPVCGENVPIDVTGIDYACQWRVAPEDAAPVATATIDASDAVNGIVDATVDGPAVRALGEGTFVVEFSDVTNETTLFSGLVTLEEDAVR